VVRHPEISRVGVVIRTDHELAPIREVEVGLKAMADAVTRYEWQHAWRRPTIVITVADMRNLEGVDGNGGQSGTRGRASG
jgi:hypothetical protein